jgi:protein MpaA
LRALAALLAAIAGGGLAGAASGMPVAPPAPSAGGPPRGAAASGLERRLQPLLRLGSRPCCGETHRARILLGRSTEGRPIRLEATAAAGGRRRRPGALVFGCIHGTECAGIRAVRYIGGGCPPPAPIWAVPNLNPDGYGQGTRLNGRGVDLNRNFPSGWRPIGQRYGLEYSGPRPFSERETRLAARLIRLVRPRITIWFHQEARPLVRAWGQSVPAARRYARIARLPFHRLPWLAGTAPNWQNHRFPHAASFVVELPLGRLSQAQASEYGTDVFRLVAGWRSPRG